MPKKNGSKNGLAGAAGVAGVAAALAGAACSRFVDLVCVAQREGGAVGREGR
tara:strand:+ start:2243 stop:2398 length:156 start_codon:yes stop_codon:yes gene_type:complete